MLTEKRFVLILKNNQNVPFCELRDINFILYFSFGGDPSNVLEHQCIYDKMNTEGRSPIPTERKEVTAMLLICLNKEKAGEKSFI